jgi:acetyl esterase/lipase
MRPRLVIALLLAPVALSAQQPLPIQDGQVIPLWSGPAPGALGADTTDIPAIAVFLPRNVAPNTPAIIICPGGSYQRLASNHEGRQVANYMNSMGIAAFVLRYRLGPRYHHPIELGDVQRAIRLVRSHASEWHLDGARIGIMGFSAGGHLAMTASTHFDLGNARAVDPVDRISARPDIAILGYPVISMTEPWTHAGSRTALLGEHPDPELAARLSGEKAVTKDTPPTFIFQTNEDTTVPAENAIYYFLALRRAGVPAEMHVFERGVHGLGLANADPALSEWSKLLANWLRVHDVLK